MKRITIESLISFMEKVNKEGVPEDVLLSVWVREITPLDAEQSVSINMYHKKQGSIFNVKAYNPNALKGTPAFCAEVGHSQVQYVKDRYVQITETQFFALTTACIAFLAKKSQESYTLCESLGLELEPYSDLEVI